MDCRCDDAALVELGGEEALEYRRHLERVGQEGQAWLLRCPITNQEWVEDFTLDPIAREWVGTARLRRFPFRKG
jgi:hypothetical protein